MDPEAILHDTINVYILAVIVSLSTAGILGYFSNYVVTWLMFIYIIVDLVWIVYIPKAIPSLQPLIVLHHIAVIGLVTHPLLYPEDAIWTSLDALVELNTIGLLGRRQRLGQSIGFPQAIWFLLYWASFLTLRLSVYPWLLWKFSEVLIVAKYGLFRRWLVLSCQAVLCMFNLGFLFLSLRHRKSKGARFG